MKDHQILFYSYTLHKNLVSPNMLVKKNQTIMAEISPNESARWSQETWKITAQMASIWQRY